MRGGLDSEKGRDGSTGLSDRRHGNSRTACRTHSGKSLHAEGKICGKDSASNYIIS